MAGFSLMLTTLVFIALLLALIGAAVYLRKNWRGEEVCEADLLEEFRELKEQGEISTEEYSRIKQIIVRRVQHAPDSTINPPVSLFTEEKAENRSKDDDIADEDDQLGDPDRKRDDWND